MELDGTKFCSVTSRLEGIASVELTSSEERSTTPPETGGIPATPSVDKGDDIRSSPNNSVGEDAGG